MAAPITAINSEIIAQNDKQFVEAMQATPETEYKNLTQDAIMQPYYQDAIGSAIQNRSKEKYNLGIGKMKARATREAQHGITGKYTKASELVRQEEKINDQIQEQRRAKSREQEAARAQILGSMMGILGGVVGGVVGGPGGAAAGSAVGSAAGSEMARSK